MTETCGQCRFDAGEYTSEDLRGTLRSFGERWAGVVADVDALTLAARPAPGTWSALEYAAHTRDVLMFAEGGAAGPVPGGDMAMVVSALDAAALELARRLPRMLDADGTVAHAVHEAEHHLQDVGRGLHRLGAGAPSESGRVAQVNTSAGGVPKLPVSGPVTVGRRGVGGDRQGNRVHHGRPSQALCLWSSEVIEALAAEGHPIAPGCAGENVTVTGLTWSRLRPGVRLQLGSALAEVTGYADPCVHNARWFLDRGFGRIDQAKHPGWSRVYAAVLADGSVEAGDQVIVEPS